MNKFPKVYLSYGPRFDVTSVSLLLLIGQVCKMEGEPLEFKVFLAIKPYDSVLVRHGGNSHTPIPLEGLNIDCLTVESFQCIQFGNNFNT